jgi:N-methylhydantoinase A
MVATEPTAEPRIGERRAYFDGWRTVPVYRIEALRPGMTVEGPAIFDAETTTVLAADGDAVTANRYGWLDIRLRR